MLLYIRRMLFDAHTHLNSDQLYPDRQTHAHIFATAGGEGLVNIGVNQERNQRAIDIAAQRNLLKKNTNSCNLHIKATIGIHPGEISFGNIADKQEIQQNIDTCRQLYKKHQEDIVAIGECGIDAHYDNYNQHKVLQKILFHEQCLLARELDLPIVIHSRDQFSDSLDVLKKFSDLKIYFHCWGYTSDQLHQLSKALPNLRIGFCGNITYKKASLLRDSFTTARELMKEKKLNLLLETDAPYLSPQTKRGETNTPKNIQYIYEYISNTYNISIRELTEYLQKSFKKLYQ